MSRGLAVGKRQRAGAVQDAGALAGRRAVCQPWVDECVSSFAKGPCGGVPGKGRLPCHRRMAVGRRRFPGKYENYETNPF